MLEYTLIFSVMILLTLGLFELGRAVWVYNTVAHSAREAARYAGLHGEYQPASNSDVLQVAQAHAIGLDSSLVSTTTSYVPDRSFGSFVQVSVNYPMPYMFSPLIFGNATLNLNSTANVVVTQ